MRIRNGSPLVCSRKLIAMLDGWLYGLVNVSNPGLLKVGQTVRKPSVRASELSSSTGVPTPFQVAFDFPCFDVRRAETAVHRIMEERGWRVSTNREFFRCTPLDAIRIIEEYALTALPSGMFTDHLSTATLLVHAHSHLSNNRTFERACYALTLYRQAAKRGSLQAYEGAARAHLFLDQSDPFHARAFQQLKAGCKAGNYYCYAMMARLLGDTGDADNMKRAWSLFFTSRAMNWLRTVEQEEDDPLPRAASENVRFTRACRQYIGSCLRLGVAPQNLALLRSNATSILTSQQSSLQLHASGSQARLLLLRAMEWTFVNLSAPSMVPLSKPNLSGNVRVWTSRRAAAYA